MTLQEVNPFKTDARLYLRTICHNAQSDCHVCCTCVLLVHSSTQLQKRIHLSVADMFVKACLYA